MTVTRIRRMYRMTRRHRWLRRIVVMILGLAGLLSFVKMLVTPSESAAAFGYIAVLLAAGAGSRPSDTD